MLLQEWAQKGLTARIRHMRGEHSASVSPTCAPHDPFVLHMFHFAVQLCLFLSIRPYLCQF